MTYTIRVPLLPSAPTRIGAEEATLEREQLTLSLKPSMQYCVLSITGLKSEEDAAKFLERLPAGIANLLFERNLPIEATLIPQRIQYADDPIAAGRNLSANLGGLLGGPVDSILDGSETAVYPSAKNMRFATLGQPAIYTTTPASQVLEVLLQGTRLPGAHRLASDPKLITALKLYGAHFWEQSATTKFLSLVMALESLAVPTPKSDLALKLLERWQQDLNSVRATLAGDPEGAMALDALERELFFRRADSVRTQIRKVVHAELKNDADASVQAREALRLYDIRSTLLHTGYVDGNQLGAALPVASALVKRVLLTRFSRLTRKEA